MTNNEKIEELRTLLFSTLLPLIDNNYILLDIPYYSNPGDTLIWEGTEQLLKNCPHKCLIKTAEECFDFPRLKKQTVILLQGGGNWGDLWSRHQEFRMRVIENYKDNKIIVLPQSIHYENLNNWDTDVLKLKQHDNLHICVRDIPSFELLKSANLKYTYLLPDMAFCIQQNSLLKFVEPCCGKKLLVMRHDSESPKYDKLKIDINNPMLDVCDWPTMESYDHVQLYFYRIYNRRKYGLHVLTDFYADKILRTHIVKTAVKFISKYEYIYTTRLHVAILSVLLNKSFTLIDNSYGKNFNLYKTWLTDLNTIRLQS